MDNVYRQLGSEKDTGGLWNRLDAEMAARPAPDASAGLGLWGMIVADNVGGVWDELDHETVMLRADQIRRERLDLWDAASEETLILPREGLLPVWDAALVRTDAAGGMDANGTLMLLRQDAANVWQRTDDETLMLSRPAESIFAQKIHPRDLTTFRPQ